jgi:hypothetical protein
MTVQRRNLTVMDRTTIEVRLRNVRIAPPLVPPRPSMVRLLGALFGIGGIWSPI